MFLLAIVTCFLILLGFFEAYVHRRMLAQIPLRILVNGTRGKTTVTRMIAATLNQAGIKTYAKTTGSDARRIFPDGSERSYRKRGVVSLMEQLPFARLAVKGSAQAIVVECMALRPESQLLMAEKLVCPQYVIITNAFVDHIEEIGATYEETIRVLALSAPKDAVLITNDANFGDHHSNVVVPAEGMDLTPFEKCRFVVFEQNLRLVCALAERLDIPYETVVQGVLHTVPDIGMQKAFSVHGMTIRNAFAVNDAQSFSECLRECGQQGGYALLFNHRPDRLYRIEAFARVIHDAAVQPKAIGVIGQDKAWAARYLARGTMGSCTAVAESAGWLKTLHQAGIDCVVCAGNIKGEGRAFLESLMRETVVDV